MNECVEEFKMELEKLYKEMYDKIDELICNTLVVMSFFNDGDENYEMLRKAIMDVAQEQIKGLIYKEESLLN